MVLLHLPLEDAPQVFNRVQVWRQTFTFMHLADTFIQSDLQCIQAIHFFYQYVCSLGIEPTTFWTHNLMQCSTTEPQEPHTWPLHHLQLHQQGSCHLGGVFGVIIMLDNCRLAQFLKGGHHLLLQNVTVHVGIHVSLNEPQLPSTSITHAAPDHDTTTTMLDCRQGTIFLVLLTRASPHMLDTI